ncbi:MAG: hypothetical protein M3414_03970 [Pseudomonadota bacterium]|nr:hypothetical protein [Pseudomonadota bacterium]
MKAGKAIFDEMGWPDETRAPYALVDSWLKSVPPEQLALKRREAEVLIAETVDVTRLDRRGGSPRAPYA